MALAPLYGCGGVSDETARAFEEPPPGEDGAVGGDTGTVPSSDAPGVDSPATDSGSPIDTAPAPIPGDRCDTAPVLASDGTVKEIKGDTSKAANDLGGHTCNPGAGNDVVFQLTHPGGDLLLDAFGSSADTVLGLRTTCGDPGSQKACSYQTSGAPGTSRLLYRGLDAGTYFVVVDAASGGGPFRLGYASRPLPAQLGCDAEPVVLSDVEGRATGIDLYDRVANSGMTSRVVLRPGPTGTALCPTASGESGYGAGAEQIYRLNLSAPRTIKISAEALSPPKFGVSDPSARFDLLLYLRNAEGPPTGSAVDNCKQSSGSTSDKCVTLGTEMALPKGSYWLVIDSWAGSTGRFHLHIDIK